jgi:ribonuclease P protein component
VTAKNELRFPRWRRLRSSRDFARIYALRQRAGDRHLLIFAARNELGFTRIGLSVSRKHGNSVLRHRIRRLLKEAYRLEQHAIPEGFDLILIPGKTSGEATVQDYRASLKRLTRRLAASTIE